MGIALIVGLAMAAMGWARAARRGGKLADRLQYAAAHGVAGFLLGLIVLVIAGRLGLLA